MKDTAIVSMGLLAFMVALNEKWLPFLKGWVQASVGGPGYSNLSRAGSAVGNVDAGGLTGQATSGAQVTQQNASGIANSTIPTRVQ